MSAYKDVFDQILENCSKISNETFSADSNNSQSREYAFVADYEFWINIIRNNNRKEASLYEFALKEYNVGQLLLTLGLYKQSFQSLRSFLETTLFTLSLSTNELDLNLWLQDKRDLYWSLITDSEKGVFSTDFFSAFCPLLTDYKEEFFGISKQIYRECSEYVHGNYGAQSSLPFTNSFNVDVFASWHSKAEIIQRILMLMFFVRYNTHITSEVDAIKTQSILTTHVGNFPEFEIILIRE